MSEEPPFRRRFDLEPGIVDEPLPGIRRVLADNPSPFTFTGTLCYIVGRGTVAIIDPGIDDDAHIAAILDAVRGETVSHILVTHTHRDHSPAVPRIKEATGATVLAEGPHRLARELHAHEVHSMDAAADTAFEPDQRMRDGDVVSGPGWTLEAVTTPGHTMNHLSFALRETPVLFSGDHVMGWSTSIVAPPDGSMSAYMDSLRRIQQRPEQLYFPGHGDAVPDAQRFVGHLIAHRQMRENAILKQLQSGLNDIPSIVERIYVGIDKRLFPAARLSVFAHLEDLVERGRVATDGAPMLDGTYRAV